MQYLILIVFLMCLTGQNDALFAKFGAKARSSVDTLALKQEIKQLAKGTQNGIKASEEKRLAITTAVKQLEKVNPVKKLSSTEKLDGSWKLVYTTNEGSSAGKLGPLPFVGEVVQNIDLRAGNYVNYVRLPLVEGALTASWDNLNDRTWRVKFESINFKLAGISLVSKPLTAEGIWRLTYVDDDLRVLYAQGNAGKTLEQKDKVTENIYILSK